MMSIKDSIAVLAATKPPNGEKVPWRYRTAGTANARIAELETKLGLKHGNPIFSITRANLRINQLESLESARSGEALPAVADNGAANADTKLPAQAVAPAAAADPVKTPQVKAPVAAAEAARTIQLTGDKTTDAAISASGCVSLAEYRALQKRDALKASVAGAVPGSTTHACFEKNLTAAENDLKNFR